MGILLQDSHFFFLPIVGKHIIQTASGLEAKRFVEQRPIYYHRVLVVILQIRWPTFPIQAFADQFRQAFWNRWDGHSFTAT